MRNMRLVILTSLLIIVVVISFSCVAGPKYSGTPEKISIGSYYGELSALIFVADKMGYFRNNGLDAEIRIYETGAKAVSDLEAGKLDVATCAEFVVVSRCFADDELRILSEIATADIHEVIARKDSGIEKPADLKGSKIGVSLGTSAEFFLGLFLQYNGMSIKDVEEINLSPSQIIKRLSEGELAAACTWDPYVYEIKGLLGDKIISWPAQTKREMYWLLVSRVSILKDKPYLGERLLSALSEAESFVSKNPQKTREIITASANLGQPYINYVWEKDRFAVGLSQSLLIAMEDEARWMIKNGLTTATKVPNYINYIYFDGILAAKPGAVTIIR